MRILHTSDWHLGVRLCERERIDEQKEFLKWLLLQIDRESIDILLISGDIFDSTNPPNSAEALYYDFLCKTKETCCSAVVIIGGNHDSVSKLNSPKSLLEHLSVFVCGGGESPEGEVFSIVDKEGIPLAVICAVPFLRERDVHTPKAGESWQEREESINAGIKEHYKKAREYAEEKRGDLDIPVIAMGHLFVSGSRHGAGERDLYVGNLGAVNLEPFDSGFDYTALGHIHKSQKIGNRNEIRYCGSPISMDFGETGVKSVLIADFNNALLSEVRTNNVPVFRELVRFKGQFNDVISDIEEFEPPETPFWADVEVLGGDSVGDISRILNDLAERKGFELLKIKINSFTGENVLNQESSIEISDFTPEEVFIKRCEKSEMNQEEIESLLPFYKELLVSIQDEAGSYED